MWVMNGLLLHQYLAISCGKSTSSFLGVTLIGGALAFSFTVLCSVDHPRQAAILTRRYPGQPVKIPRFLSNQDTVEEPSQLFCYRPPGPIAQHPVVD